MRDGASEPPPLSSPPDIEAAWMDAMRRGDWARAWALSDSVLAARDPADFDRPWTPYHTRCVWDGRPLAGRRVLIRCYHGLGDTIQFIRFGATLRAQGCAVLVEAQPELIPLIRPCGWVEAVVPLGGAETLTHDAAIESMELPHALRALPKTVPNQVPYLHPGDAAPTLPAGDGRLRVGLVWRAGDWDPHRSLDLEALAPLLAVTGVRFVGLQLGADAAGPHRPGVADAASPDLPTLAANLRGLDLLVSVDTMAAHLAGALGRPVWTLLRAGADWRWGLGDRTPWYPTMRLFRQAAAGDWSAPVAAAATALAAWAAKPEGVATSRRRSQDGSGG